MPRVASSERWARSIWGAKVMTVALTSVLGAIGSGMAGASGRVAQARDAERGRAGHFRDLEASVAVEGDDHAVREAEGRQVEAAEVQRERAGADGGGLVAQAGLRTESDVVEEARFEDPEVSVGGEHVVGSCGVEKAEESPGAPVGARAGEKGGVLVLLPSREKVDAKRTDEGAVRDS